jgi:3-deoxy-D-manno-octulosonic-acid transferase
MFKIWDKTINFFTIGMKLLYSIVVHLLYLVILIASLFNKKALLWIIGRQGWRKRLKHWQGEGAPTLWFHVASLGEFEQGLPVMESLREKWPDSRILLTFYSPSGYEIRKNYPNADFISYLPLDTGYNARRFLILSKPDAAFFIKYEFWYFYLQFLHQKAIPVYLISGIFREEQTFFRWYGSWFRKGLGCFSHFFLQDAKSAGLLKTIGMNNVTVTGDTRFDRVMAKASRTKTNSIAEAFSKGSNCIVAGSTWPSDEKLIADYINQAEADRKVIIAPHEIDDGHLQHLESLIRKSKIRYSAASRDTVLHVQVLIIDNIGMLSSLYRYGQIAYIGGGFGKGIHNILEAAVFGMPVLFGPNHAKFREAEELIKWGSAFSVNSYNSLKEKLDLLILHPEIRQQMAEKAGAYVSSNAGATRKITEHVLNDLSIKA